MASGSGLGTQTWLLKHELPRAAGSEELAPWAAPWAAPLALLSLAAVVGNVGAPTWLLGIRGGRAPHA